MKVQLSYALSEDRYYVEKIMGDRPTLTLDREGVKVSVGAVLSESEVKSLGLLADLTIKRMVI